MSTGRSVTYDWRCKDCTRDYGSGYVPMETLAEHHAATRGHTVEHIQTVTFSPGTPAAGEGGQ